MAKNRMFIRHGFPYTKINIELIKKPCYRIETKPKCKVLRTVPIYSLKNNFSKEEL